MHSSTTTTYAAACNPPRRAKRRRTDDRLEEEEEQEEEQEEEDAPPKRRGRRPGTLSRAAREAQRKINHSLIEKARRTKINDALATLRELVPPDAAAPDEDEDEDEHKLRPKPKAAGEKEFKLEILVRTVAYLQHLTDRVRLLEQTGCPRCSAPISLGPAACPASPAKRTPDEVSPARASIALPSISAWLPANADEQRALLHTPSQSPACTGQLPTPPASAVCAPATTGFQMPPVLTLPSPSAFLPPTTPRMQPRFYGFTPRHAAPAKSSPVMSPEDETAASLLLCISATSPRAAAKPGSVRPPEASYALTPSRLLGLSAER